MPDNKTRSNKIREILKAYEKSLSEGDKTKSLRFSAGLLGVSHTAFSDWKSGRYAPKYEQLIECKELIAASYQTVNDLMAAIAERDTADLVVAERVE